jgi:hypothetical protein
MSKVSKNKKLLLGSALAGLVLSGPGLSVTANTESGAKFFQTAQLEVGYRLAGAADTKPAAVPAATPTKATPATPASDKKDADKHCCPDQKCSGDKKCGKDGKCSGDKKCGKDGKCASDKKTEATTPATGTKPAADKACGSGSCGPH